MKKFRIIVTESIDHEEYICADSVDEALDVAILKYSVNGAPLPKIVSTDLQYYCDASVAVPC